MKKIYSIVTLLLIIFTGAILAGCSPDYGSLSLSLKDVEKIELSITDEKADFYLVVNNYFDFNAKFDFSFSQPIAKYVENSIEYSGDGIFKFSIAPITVGSASVTISIVGIENKITIPVVVKQNVESITPIENAFVKKGGSLKLDANLFIFTPTDTPSTQKGLIFSFKEQENTGVTLNQELGILSVSSTCELEQITLIATSTYNNLLFEEITIKIVKEVDVTNNLSLQVASQKTDNQNQFGDYSNLEIKKDGTKLKTDVVELVTSDQFGYQKKIKIEYSDFASGYAIDVLMPSILMINGVINDKVTITQNSEIVISAEDIGQTAVVLRAYKTDMVDNYTELTIPVNVITKPQKITVNGSATPNVIELYTNTDTMAEKTFKLDIAPSKVDLNNYYYQVELYSDLSSNEIPTSASTVNSLSDFVELKYGGASLTTDNVDTLTILNASLTVKATNQTNGKYLAVKLTCFENGDEERSNPLCSVEIYIKVYIGTENFRIDEKYKNATIYLDIDKGTQEFYGLKCDDGATPGNMSIYSNISKMNICTIEQISTSSTTIKITPNSVGEQDYTITTENNKSVVLHIVVIRTIEMQDFKLQIEDTSNNYISDFTTDNAKNNTLKSITLKGISSSVNITAVVTTDYNDYNNYSYVYTLSVEDGDDFIVANNKTVTSKNFVENVTLVVDLTINTVVNFGLERCDIVDNYFNIQLGCVNYIKELTLNVSSDSSGKTLNRSANIYNQGDLSYINQNLATVHLFMNIKKDREENTSLNIKSIIFMIGATEQSQSVEANGTRVKIGTIGYFYPSNDLEKKDNSDDYAFVVDTAGYMGYFVYDNKGLGTINSISVILRITDSNTNDQFSSFVDLTIEKYIDVDSIWLSTPDDNIYLDSTDTYSTKTIFVQIMPANAMCKDIDVYVETLNLGCLDVEITNSGIRFSYLGKGSGKILIFPVSKMKTNSYKNENGEYYYHLELDFTCADGSSEPYALKISNVDDLKSVVSNLHYFVDTTIDCQGQTINIANFNASLRGTFVSEVLGNGNANENFDTAQQTGSIVNFKIANYSGKNVGLFGTLGEDAKIYNISFSGYFNDTFDFDQDVNMGLLCGVNEGVIKNVSVSLYKTNNVKIVTNNSSISVRFGLVAGCNKKEILIDNDCKDSTLFASNDNNSALIIDFSTTKANMITSYFGGIVGTNYGTIKQDLPNDFITIGLFGVSASIYVSSNATYFAGAVGENTGLISGLKILGELIGAVSGENNIKTYASYVAGFVGSANGGDIENNISRTFVRGYKNVSGFIGSMGATSSTEIKNNKVQATDDGTRFGINASLIVGYDNANIWAVGSDIANDIAGVVCETYFDRSLPADLIAYINGLGKDITTPKLKIYDDENPSESYSVGDLVVEYYYGDMIVLKNSGKTLSVLDYQQSYARGEEDELVTANFISHFIMSAFIEALDKNNQEYISNILDAKSVLEYANILGETSKVKDITINIMSPLVARTENSGKSIELLNIGSLIINIQSSLNYKKSAQLNLYVTNYYEEIKFYSDKDKTIEVSEIELVNKQTSIVYIKAYSSAYNYKNTPISLKDNTEITFNADISADDINKMNVSIQGQMVFIDTKGDDVKQFDSSITFTTLFNYNGNHYYKNTQRTIDGQNGYKFYSFTLTNSTDIETNNKTVLANTGIENIKLSKNIVESEPSETIDFTLTYNTYNTDDFIIAQLKVYESVVDNKYETCTVVNEDFNKKDGSVSFGKNGKVWFVLSWNRIEVSDNKYSIIYSFNMPVNTNYDEEVYNFLKNKHIELKFVSNNFQSQNTTLIVQYKPETISNVLINNYNRAHNSGMIVTNYGISTVDTSKLNVSGSQSATGELNVVNAYVSTKLSEFDYVDISLNIPQEGGFLGYLDYTETADGTIGKISNNSVYTSITNGAVLRVYREDIKLDPLSDLPIIGVVYKIPKTVQDGTIVSITFTFNSETMSEPYVSSIDLVTKMSDQVSFEIDGKVAVQEYDNTRVYNVAKGMKYLLNTTIVGFEEDEAVFESSNGGIAKITYESGNYYLTISSASIDYGTDETGKSNGYFEVLIRSYGKKGGTSSSVSGLIKTTQLRVFEFLVDEYNLFGDDTQIDLRLLEEVNIKDLIVNKINYEASRENANYITEFKNSFTQNANFYFIDEQENAYLLKDGFEKESKNNYSIKCYKDKNGNLRFSFKPMSLTDNTYKFEVVYDIVYSKGIPQAVAIEDEILSDAKRQTFSVSVHISSTGKNPVPVFNYEDMKQMMDGEYYRQVSDITISPSEFEMITSQPKLFDGNGYKIKILEGVINFDLDSSSDFALFKNIGEDCILKNVTIEIMGNLTFTLNNNLSANGANIAILVAENSGAITNCFVKSAGVVSTNIISTIEVVEKSYFASICAKNTGYITNSRVECNLTTNGSSLAGFVAQNEGSISSSYVKESRIYNTTSTTSESLSTAGFVCNNTGNILMSYVEGVVADNRIYADYPNADYSLSSKIIYATTKVAGFVYENSGDVADCYSNIPIVSTTESSGFVAKASSGTIKRVFSLSKLKQQDTLNFGFVATYDKASASFEDCFFIIQEGIINYNTSQTNYQKVNSEIIGVIDGVEPVSIAEFNLFEKNGNNYVLKTNSKFASFITDSEADNGVWFYVYDETKENNTGFDVNTYSCEVTGFNYNSTSKFVARRLHLVAPNTIAYSKYYLDLENEEALQTGDYSYSVAEDSDYQGTKFNPYLISSASDFETYCNQYSSLKYEYFRMIKDIDYEKEEVYSSKLYNKKFVGNFEGNGFTVANYSVNSITSSLSAGLFSEIGSPVSTLTCFKNVDFAPSYINLPNCIYVGGVAGSVSNANIINVSIEGENVVVIGSNIVGGLFGRTYGTTGIYHISSNITAKASCYNSIALKSVQDAPTLMKDIQFKESGINKTKVSYAGALIGYAGGVSNVKYANIGEKARVFGMIAGLMFGGLGANVTLSDFDLQLNSFDNEIVAYAFGGYVGGEVLGTVENFSINSNVLNVDLFNCYPVAPISVGGVAGYAKGAKINNLLSTEGYGVIGAKVVGRDASGVTIHNPYIARYVGGVVGYGEQLTVKSVNICYNENIINSNPKGLALMGGFFVGGVVGYVGGNVASQDVDGNVESQDVDGNVESQKVDSIINNVTINLISEKTYINAENETVTDKLYASYASNAVGEDISFYFDEYQYFGLIYGYSLSTGNSSKYASAVCGLEEATGNNVSICGAISIICDNYKLPTDLENIGSVKANAKTRMINDKGVDNANGTIKIFVVDLTTNTTYEAISKLPS